MYLSGRLGLLILRARVPNLEAITDKAVTDLASILVTFFNIKVGKTAAGFLANYDKCLHNSFFCHNCNIWHYSNLYLNILNFSSYLIFQTPLH